MMTFYTYVWLDADGIPFYVGKGSRYRAFAKSGHPKPPPKSRILIESHPSEAEAFDAEKFLIAYYGRKDLRAGPLLNRSVGGSGGRNRRGGRKSYVRVPKHLQRKKGPKGPRFDDPRVVTTLPKWYIRKYVRHRTPNTVWVHDPARFITLPTRCQMRQ